ncbi:Crp/Fnr family transcriptional regulator [Shewanella frigidimarina]|uniref:Crp/Fnr family transcriptional regulator n=1 Tax=Shewanella frigidimarina TaxID=56812 RepID=UPI000E8F82F9|nr:Crp/Fnr family transcriptional regulator [Shewanella frigidimarina]|tara:strand:- start:102028 stop:102822 length:795 start_codon:yes stop_codon:yes gene_type:complete
MALVMSLNSEMKEKSTIFFPDAATSEIMDFIKKNGVLKTLKKGELIPKSILLNNFIYLNSGLLFYIKRTNNFTKPKFVNVIIPNRLTDYHLLLDNNCTCCKSIKVARDSQITIIDKSFIKNLIKKDIELFTHFMFKANYFTERQTALAIFLLTSSPEDKLIKFLFDILVAFKTEFSSMWLTIDIKLTREEIADILHISVIKLDLMLGSLKKQGMLTKEKGMFSINTALFNELSPCPLGREDAQGCKSNNMLKFKPKNMIEINNQ